MNRLPNFINAYVGLEKLTEYCLNEFHPVGKQKAIVFKSALGIDASNALLLKEAILHRFVNSECVEKETDTFGKRFCSYEYSYF